MTTRTANETRSLTLLFACSILLFGMSKAIAAADLDPGDSCVCLGAYDSGDRVISTHELTDGPGAGRRGEVVGGFELDFLGSTLRYALVSFDNWHEGHGGAAWQSCLGNLESDQCWWVRCEWLVKLPESGPPPCQGDLNKDGIVDGADLVILLGNWGFCPV